MVPTVEIIAKLETDEAVKVFLHHVAAGRASALYAKVMHTNLAAQGVAVLSEIEGYETLSITTSAATPARLYPEKTEQDLRRELYDLTAELERTLCTCHLLSMRGMDTRPSCKVHQAMANLRTLLSDLAIASVTAR